MVPHYLYRGHSWKPLKEEGSVNRDGRKITSTSWISLHHTSRASHVCASQTSHAWTFHGAWIFHHARNEQRHGGNDRRHGRHDERHKQLPQRQHHRRAFPLLRALNFRLIGMNNFTKDTQSTIIKNPRVPWKIWVISYCPGGMMWSNNKLRYVWKMLDNCKL